MYKGISMSYGFPGYYKDRFDKIKKCGFTVWEKTGTSEDLIWYI